MVVLIMLQDVENVGRGWDDFSRSIPSVALLSSEGC